MGGDACRPGERTMRRLRSVLLLCTGVGGCATSSQGNGAAWAYLREVGFPDRAAWASAVLHVDRSGLPGSGRLSTLLSAVPGLTVVEPRGSGWGVRRELPDGTRCEPDVVLNGSRADRRTLGGDWTIDFLGLRVHADGVEVHVGSEGPLVDESGCGYVLIWSERTIAGGEIPFRGDVEGHVRIAPTVDSLEIVLEPGGRVTGVGRGGTFEFGDVLPGSYEVVVRSEGRELVRHPVRVYAFATSTVELSAGRSPG